MPFEVAHGLVRSAVTRSRAVRLHDFVPHHLSGLFHRARELPRLYRGAVAAHRQCRAPRRVRLLEENLRGGIRHGCGVGPGDELSVRYQLERIRRQDRPGAGAADGLRSAISVLPRSRLSRGDAVRAQARRQNAALLRHVDGGGGHAVLGVLDTGSQQLDAYAGRLRHQRRGPVRTRRLVGDDLQSVFSLPLRPYGAGGLSHHRAGGELGRRTEFTARPQQRRRARDAVVGADHGEHHRTAAIAGRRPARYQHPAPSAREDRRHGRPFRAPRRRAADSVRCARYGTGDHPLRGRIPAARQPDPHPRSRRRDQRPERMAAFRAAQRRNRVYQFPGDGRPRYAHGGACVVEHGMAAAASAVRQPAAALRRAADGPARLRRRAVRVDHHRGRPSALYRVRSAAHRRFRFTGRRRGGRRVARGLLRRLSGDFRRRLLLHFAVDGENADLRQRRHGARGYAGTRGGHHAGAGADPAGCRRARTMTIDLALIWAALLAFAVFAFVVLDGFDLGVGILLPWSRPEHERDQMMNSVAPVWDGNETWLVLGGGGLFAAFPLAYAVTLPALYAPITVMLLGLIFRGVAFEFRVRSQKHRLWWEVAFAGGSLAAAFSQGVVLGAYLQGIRVAERAYAGGNWDWLTPFSVLTGVALIIGYALLGATWLVMKTADDLQRRARRYARAAGIGTLILIGVVSLWTPFLHPEFAARWFIL